MRPSPGLLLALLSCAMLPAPPVRSAPVDAPAPVPAATDDLAARVNALAQPAIDDGRVAGMVIGVVDKKGATRLFGFGRISRADPRPPDGKTVFEIGSVSKVFTSTLLADLVTRKVLALDDPIKKYLPPAVKVPSHGGREITLAHLATHSSGLPRMPANFAPKDPKNPYADYAADQLYAFLSSCTLERDPGALYEYSNLGAGLLGHILTLVSKQSYDALLAARITGPLGMKSTRVVMSAGQRAGLAEGHDEAGQVAPPWDQKVFEGAGGVHSTADDMLLFLRANLHQIKSPLDGAFTLTHQPRHDTEGTPGAVGLGWHVRDVGRTIWHNGQTGGYHSYVAFDPQQQLGVVLMSSSSIGTIDGIGYRLLRWLAGEPAPPPPTALGAPTVTLSTAQLDALVGLYQLTPLFEIEIKRDGDHLIGQATGQPAFRLFSTSDTHFFLRAVPAEIDFVRDAAGKISELVLHQNGQNLHGRRRLAPP